MLPKTTEAVSGELIPGLRMPNAILSPEPTLP